MEGSWARKGQGSIEPMPMRSSRRSGMKACLVNLEDERGLISLLGVTPMVARRLVIHRPVRDISQLLTVKGLSGENLIAWEASGISLDFSTSDAVAGRCFGGSSGGSAHLRDSSNLGQSSAMPHAVFKPPPNRHPESSPGGGGDAVATEIQEEELQSSMRELNEYVSKLQKSCADLQETGGWTLAEADIRQWVARMQDTRLEGLERAILRRSVCCILRRWRVVAVESGSRSLLEYRILRRRVRSSLLLTFRLWLDTKRRSARSRRVGVCTLSRILNEVRRAAFREWHRLSRTGAQMYALQTQAGAHSGRRHLAAALRAWMLGAAACKELMVRMRRSQGRWRRNELRHKFSAWGVFCGQMQQLKRAGIKLMLRWLTMIGHLSLLRWHDVCVCRRRQRRVWAGLRMRVSLGLLRRVILEWRFVGGLRAMSRSNSGNVIGSYIGGLARRALGGALRSYLCDWKRRAVQRRAQRLSVWRRASKVMVAAARNAMDAWHHHCVERTCLHDKGVKILVKSLRVALRNALWAWWEVTQSLAHLSRSSDKVSEMTAHLAMSVSLDGWREHALRKKHFAGSCRGAGIQRLGHRRRRIVLAAWRDCHRRERKLQKLGIRMLVRWMRALTRSSFTAWSKHVFEPVAGPGVRAKGMGKRTRDRVVSRACEEWRLRLAEAQWQRSVMVRIAVRWTLVGLKRTFCALHRHATRTRVLKGSVTAFMFGVLKALCAKAFGTWHCKTLESRRLWRAGTKLVARYIRNHALTALHAWWDVSFEGRRMGMGREFPYDGYNVESLSREKSLPANSSLLPEGEESPFAEWIQDSEGVAAENGDAEQEYRLDGSQRQWMHLHAAQRLWNLALDTLLAWAESLRSPLPTFGGQEGQPMAGRRVPPESLLPEGVLQAAGALPRSDWEITSLTDVGVETRDETTRAEHVLRVLGEAGQELHIPELRIPPFQAPGPGPQLAAASSAPKLSPGAAFDLAPALHSPTGALTDISSPSVDSTSNSLVRSPLYSQEAATVLPFGVARPL